MARTLAVLLWFLWSFAALAVDITPFVLEGSSPACGAASLADKTVSICDVNLGAAALGQCGPRVVLHKEIKFPSCRSISHGVDLNPDLEATGMKYERYVMQALVSLEQVAWPEATDLHPWGKYMPDGTCKMVGEAFRDRLFFPGLLMSLDKDFTNWRACMSGLASAALPHTSSDARAGFAAQVTTAFGQIDLGKEDGRKSLEKFILRMENESYPVAPEKVLELLKQ